MRLLLRYNKMFR